MNNNTSLKIADAIFEADEAMAKAEKKRATKNEEARKMRVLVKLFEDNPDQGFKLKDILKLIDFGRPWILARLKILSSDEKQPIEIVSGGGNDPYVYQKRKPKAALIARSLIMGKWGA